MREQHLLDHRDSPMEHDAAPALEAQAISVYRGRRDDRPVIDRLSLRIPQGAVVGLVGRNGAGKSTLMECLMGLIVPQQGECRVLGKRSIELGDDIKERLGYGAQRPDLFDWLSAEGHFKRFERVYRNWSDSRASELALRLGLTHQRGELTTAAHSLSGGDQQKLSVILAMAHDPDVLVLDEPVSSLDPMARREFMRSLFERRWQNPAPRTVLISSHLLSDLERVVSHVAFMRAGRVQLFGEWDELAEHLRLMELPPGHGALPRQGVVHRRTVNDRERVVFDARRADAPPAAGRALNLDELFMELNEGAPQ